ncbi:hypothetical protein RB600_006929 [Gaeumannomyces tritici]
MTSRTQQASGRPGPPNGASALFPGASSPLPGPQRLLRSLTLRPAREVRAALRLQNGNILLAFLPVGLAGGFLGWDPVLVLTSNIVAIIPLCVYVSSSSDQLAGHFGELIGGLIGASFGNIVELIVLGLSLVAASYNISRLLKFNKSVTDTLSSLMTITAVTLTLPTALHSNFSHVSEIQGKILVFSRATASVLLATYALYLYFQLGSHKHIFLETEEEISRDEQADSDEPDNDDDGGHIDAAGSQDSPVPILHSVSVLTLSALAVAACTKATLEAVEETQARTGIPKSFIAAVLFPIGSNATELTTVIAAAANRQINHAISMIVSSILQIALFVPPALVMVGWAAGQPMTPYFKFSEALLLFFAVIVVNNLLHDGKYAYIHGAILAALYEHKPFPTGPATSVSLASALLTACSTGVKSHRHLFTEEEAPDREPLHPVSAMTVLVAATVAVSVRSDCLVDSVDGFVANLNISKAFIGLIVVPIVGNAGEFASTVKWSMNDKLGLAISVIVGSTLQIALLVTPFMVMVGWVLQKDMSLKFNAFQTLTVALSVLVVNGLVRDGRTNYFEGCLLIVAYLIVAIVFFVYPEDIRTMMVEQG